MKTTLSLIAAACIAGCAPIENGGTSMGADGFDLSKVAFETGACFGTCPVFSFTVDAEGNGVFVGKRFTAVEGEQRFRASPAEMAAFRARIKPFRPQGDKRYDWENCSVGVMSDMPSVGISWTNGNSEDSLFWYQGCREPALQAIEPDLNGAWKELPLKALVVPTNPSSMQR